jgi:hypothetical protein
MTDTTAGYGPQTEQIERILDLGQAMTPGKAERLAAAVAVDRPAWRAAWSVAWSITMDAGRDVEWRVAWHAEQEIERAAMRATATAAEWVVVRDAFRIAVLGAVLALLVWDLVGQYGLTQDHVETLIGPAVEVFGPEIIPGDAS